MNDNRYMYLRSVLANEASGNLTFELEKECKVSENVATIKLSDIKVIRKGKRVLYDASEWNKRSPNYWSRFEYESFPSWTMISKAYGAEHIRAMPTYFISVFDFKGRRIRQEDVFPIIKNNMIGKRFTEKKRAAFEQEFLKICDRCVKFDFYAMVKEAIVNSGI